ncbi:transformation/transcription domain-associated protein-like [Rhipicephalus sanguineus]|uniref:transformation/transcription domain-associated protein-like n=1 Tax=Rhipicephalus sanguineus TaxID=34632 RepID=UPI001893E6EC|nr:transformation/transcription domain-associated protein-like [Rhipicephalus sanguineus]
MLLGDFRQLSLSVIQRLSYLTQLFPHTFNEKLCDQLLQHLGCWLEVAVRTPHRGPNATEVRQCAAIIAIFHQIPAAGPAFVKPLVTLVLRHEQQLMVEASSPFQAPLRKFLERHPATALELLLAEPQVQDEQLNRFLEHLLRDGATFRAALQRNTGCIDRLAQLLDEGGPELQRLAVRIVSAVARREPQFLAERPALVARLRAVWVSDSFQTAGAAGLAQWREPKLLCRCLLGVVQQRPHEIELLFQVSRRLLMVP